VGVRLLAAPVLIRRDPLAYRISCDSRFALLARSDSRVHDTAPVVKTMHRDARLANLSWR
jgi:hypothetical protein